MKIILADINPILCEFWKRDFRGYKDVFIHNGSMFEVNGDIIVSPANSFGFMTGGVDYAISEYLGWHVQDTLQELIRHSFCGELLVGQALSVATGHSQFPWLISAPTMRVPSLIGGTINAYLSTRAALREARILKGIPVFTGMGTGTGRMPLDICSKQMLEAYEEVIGVITPPLGLRDRSLRQRAMEV
jgi:O-acetyl-ADP-ribose deacetylase (regulator of RNase III)